jgi:hypothetical protein
MTDKLRVRIENMGGEFIGDVWVKSILEIGDTVAVDVVDYVVADVLICGEEAAIIVIVED